MSQTVVSVRKHPTWGIRSKVFGLVLLSVLLPAALVGALSSWTAGSVLAERMLEHMALRASLASARTAEWFKERSNDARIFASARVVVSGLETGQAAPIGAYLAEVQERQPIYSGMGVFNDRGEFVAGAGFINEESASILDTAYLQEGAFLDWRDGEARLWVQSPVRGEVGRFVVTCDFSSLASILDDPALDRITILDHAARVLLMRPDGASAHEAAQYEIPEEGKLAEYRSADGERMLATAQAVEVLAEDLTLVVETKRASAYQAIDEMTRSIVLMSFLVVALIIPLAYGLVVSITRPLDTLTDGADAVSRGDYQVELPVRTRDEIGYLTEVFNRMTAALKKSHMTLHTLSTTDELTGLVNRRQLRKALAEAFAKAELHQHRLSLIMIDIDHFKAFNDELGHVKGDELLEHLGSFLRATVRQTDIAARYGGEEFLLVLPEASAEEGRAKAETIRREFTKRPDGCREVTLSLGVASWPEDGKNEIELIQAADQALYDAKARGRNRVAVYARPSPRKKKVKSKARTANDSKKRSTRKTAASESEPVH